MSRIDYVELMRWLMPELLVLAGALVALFVDLGAMRGQPAGKRARVAVLTGCLGIVAAIIGLVLYTEQVRAFEGMLVLGSFTSILKVAILVMSGMTLVLFLEKQFTEHIGEYVALILMATVGLMLLVSTEELLLAFVALELVSLSLYVLTAFNKENINSVEAALKYFLFGSVAAGFTLFGLSLVYGAAGATSFEAIGGALRNKGLDPLLMLALVLTLIGFGFKVAAVPFHLWAPDAYQGAPIPSVALIASASKVAGFILFARLLMVAFPGQIGSADFGRGAAGWASAVGLLAVLSMILGNLLAIAQKNVRRMLAYSAIAHAGYALLAVISNSGSGLTSLAYYMITYGVAVIGAFAVIGLVETSHGEVKLADLSGLYKRSPLAALCLMIFILSLAGIPPLAGFFGKFYVFVALLNSSGKSLGTLWLVILAVATSAVSLYYYLQILRFAFVADSQAGQGMIRPAGSTKFVMGTLAGLVVLAGVLPNLLVAPLATAAKVPLPARSPVVQFHTYAK